MSVEDNAYHCLDLNIRGHCSLAGKVHGHGFNINLVWVRVGFGLSFMGLSWVWVE